MARRVFPTLTLGAYIALSTMGPDCGGSTEPPEDAVFFEYDVTAYDYTFDLATGQARSIVSLTALSAGNCIALDYRLSGLASIEIDGVVPEWDYVGDDQVQACAGDVAPGATVTVATTQTVSQQTEGMTDIGYSATRDAQGNSFYYMVSWVEGCSLFGPCYDDPDDFAHYAYHVTHPTGYQLLCPGTLSPGSTSSSCDFTLDGAPTYTGFGFLASPSWTRVSLGTMAGIAVDLYDEPALNAAAKVDKAKFADFLQWVQGQFNPYPFGSALRFAIGPTYWWGFEHPGNIALAESLVNASGSYQDPLLHVMMHETTHQWAGNETTIAGVYDFVWKEAMAEYIPFMYESGFLDPVYAARTLAVWTSGSAGVAYYPVPEDEPALIDYYGDVYGPGPMVLFRQLEVLFGRDKVLAALKSVLGSPRFLSVADLQAALEAATATDLTEYFDEWVYGSGAPKWPAVTVSYTDTDGDGTWSIQVTQAQGNGVIYGFKSTLRLRGPNGATFDVPFSYGADGSVATLNLSAKPGFTVTGVDVDPYDEALVTLKGATIEAARYEFRPF